MVEEIQVSVICLAYNHEKYVKKALDSILLQQTNFQFEIIVNDDASNDNTIAILKQYKDRYPRVIKLCLHEKNQYSMGEDIIGPLIHMTNGKYVAFCECDDFFDDNNKLQKQFDFLEKHEDYVAYVHSVWRVDETGEHRLGFRKPYVNNKTTLNTKDIINCCLENYALNSLMTRKKVVYPFPSFYYLSTVGDIPLALTIATKGNIFFDDTPMSSYRMGAVNSWTQSTGKNTKKAVQYYQGLIDTLEEYDLYTENKYHKEIKNKLIAIEYWKAFRERPIDIFRKKPLLKYYMQFEVRTKIKLFFMIIVNQLKIMASR